MLRAEGLTVHFGGVHALDGVDLSVATGRVTGLIGPNGAGKTTLFNAVTGLQPPTRGRVVLDGVDITDTKPHQRARAGIARTFQRLEVFDTMSVRENVLVGIDARNSWGAGHRAPRPTADALLERVGLIGVAEEPVDVLPTGLARLVELARGLATEPRLLLLDEPASGLDETETAALGSLLLDLASDGVGVLLVEHDVELVNRICTDVFVLDFGRLIAHGSPEEIRADPVVQAAYLGDEDPVLDDDAVPAP
jgi:branched-chain amino acid transport system ATP-binding protein